MTAMDTTKLVIDAITRSKFRLSMADHPENDLADTRRPTLEMDEARSPAALGGASKRHDGEMLTPAARLDMQFESRFWASSHERVRRSARQPSRPAGSRLESWHCASRNRARKSVPKRGILMDIHRLRWPVVLRKLASPGVRDRKSSSFRNP